MEINNGIESVENTEQKEVTIEQVVNENQELKKVVNQLFMENQQLKNTWVLNRVNILMKAVELKIFDDETNNKAVAELTAFLFPKPVEQESKEEK